MKLTSILSILLFLSFSLSIVLGCSNAKSPLESDLSDNQLLSDNLPNLLEVRSETRTIIAAYEVTIDPIAQTMKITPSERTVNFHFPLTQMYPNSLQITGYGFTPNFWADIKLQHPFPGSGIDAFDPRVIAIIPAHAQAGFFYQTLFIYGNPAILLEHDGYTKNFDDLGGAMLGNVNPFKAYFKGQPNRIWSSNGVTQETQRFNMNLSGFGGTIKYQLVVDVSTNFPNQSQPIIDNAPEPVMIESEIDTYLTPDGGSAEISVTILDWQGESTVGSVQVEAPSIFNGTVSLAYSSPGQNPDEYVFTGTITNEKSAPIGEYKYLVMASDQSTGIAIYNEFILYVDEEPSVDGNLIWARRAGGTGDDESRAIARLSDDSTIVTGQYLGDAIFGEGEINETELPYYGLYDVFIARYNTDGTLAWAKRAGGEGYDRGYGISKLSDDSVIVTGQFSGTATFGQGEPNQTILSAFDGGGVFIAKYNSNGTLAWVKKAAGDSSAATGFSVSIFSDNSFVITGGFYNNITFGSGEPNQTILYSSGYFNIFVARYNSNGTLAWAKKAGSPGDQYGASVVALSDSSAVVTGHFDYTVTFGQSEPNQTVLTSNGEKDIFVAKYNSNGTLAWAKKAGGSGYDYGRSISKFTDNSTIVTGCFYSSSTFGGGEPNETVLSSSGYDDIFIARYSTNGTLAWVKKAGGSMPDVGYAITVLPDNSFALTGAFQGTAIFGAGDPNQTSLVTSGVNDVFIAKYYADGTLFWAKRAGGTSHDISYAITILSNGSSVITGGFQSPTVIFGLGEPNETSLSNSGNQDFFIASFMP